VKNQKKMEKQAKKAASDETKLATKERQIEGERKKKEKEDGDSTSKITALPRKGAAARKAAATSLQKEVEDLTDYVP
jgi:hypothetical protein